MSNYVLAQDFNSEEPIRAGFGRGLKIAGDNNANVVALCADLTESIHMHVFKEAHPDRFIQVGISEQNLITVSSGLARAGKIPFAGSYAAFNPGRNWEQIKTTVCINDQPVKIVGCHSGINVGPDGATHQMLEDIALMRCLPNMTVIAPGDSIEAEKATIAAANSEKPCYLRLARIKTPIFSSIESPFKIGEAYILKEGTDVTLVGTGTMTSQLLIASKILYDNYGISAEVVHVPTIKPLDEDTIIGSVQKTGRVVTSEEAQIIGGLGSAVAEILCEKIPMPMLRLGINDRFGESGEPLELLDYFGLTGEKMALKIQEFVKKVPKYQKGF
jgi:transketolase